jgi:hypothetical protein
MGVGDDLDPEHAEMAGPSLSAPKRGGRKLRRRDCVTFQLPRARDRDRQVASFDITHGLAADYL